MDTLYKQIDSILLKENLSKLTEQIKIKQNELYKPTFEDKLKIHNIILTYIQENKRKIYGGYALNKLLMSKLKDSFYKEYDIPDIDFYSPDPNQDIIKLCNLLFDSGFTKVNGREAKHPNTYSIYVNFDLYCDITYAPKNIYNKIPYIILDNIYYTNPSFMIIDYLKIITDPMGSYWRIEKAFDRLLKLYEFFPLPKFTKEIYIGESDNDANISESIEIIKNEIKNKDIVIVGFEAYNYYLNKSRLFEKNNKINQINIPYLEIISKNYKTDFDNIIAKLKEKFQEKFNITHTEFQPFFNFLGNSVEIYLDSELILIIYDYNKMCIPYNIQNDLKMGTYTTTLLYAQINVMKFRMNDSEDFKHIYMIMVSHLIQMKNYYFTKNNKKTVFDDTPFKDFVINCLASEINPDHAILLKYEHRRSQNKPSMFIYNPSISRKEEKDPSFYFPNISGNQITNEKGLKLTGDNTDNFSECEEIIQTDIIQTDIIQTDIIQTEQL